MRRQTLKRKIGLYLTVALSLAMLTFTVLVGWYLRNQLLHAASDHIAQLAEVITRSTRFAMLQNQPTYVAHILKDVASQGNIDKVRIVSKDGRIVHSTHAPEIGKVLDGNAEACVSCHRAEVPLDRLPKDKKTWTFTTAEGRRMLGGMEVIRNEPACYNAACHQHHKDTSVLGVVDIVYSIDDMERSLWTGSMTVAGLSLGFILIASLSVGLFVHRLVYVPLRDVGAGALAISSGDLERTIPVRSDDEFGQLAASFNAMTAALRNSQSELREWGRLLEEKVEKRTQELRRAQAETVRGEKLASVGLLASGIAHELNSPLTGILTFSHLLRQKTPDGSPDAEDLDLVIRETKRCAAIIKRLLDFAREKPPERKYADLNLIIEDTVRIVERPAHLRDIEIKLDLDRTLPNLWVDADQIRQVVMNMLVNAQHAVDEKGSITIESRRSPTAKSPEPGAPPIPMAVIAITDTGCGIPPGNLQRIFDPFFTSKEVGRGTGLGLSISHGIVKAHGGLIEVDSEVGKGSSFRIYLPLEPAAELAAAKESESVR
jgi:two-component system NtrC family sensor kinase